VVNRYLRDAAFKLEPNAAATYIFHCCNTTMWHDKEWNKRKVSFEDWMEAAE
jgi:hypothetical protein